MGGSPGGGSTTSKTTTSLPGWEAPFARAYLSSLAGLVFPQMTLPANYLGTFKNYDFGQQPASAGPFGGTGGGTGGGGGSAGPGGMPSVDAGILSAFADPMISTSPFLQNQLAQNPAGAMGAVSPAAMNQLGQIYPALMGGAATPSRGMPFPTSRPDLSAPEAETTVPAHHGKPPKHKHPPKKKHGGAMAGPALGV